MDAFQAEQRYALNAQPQQSNQQSADKYAKMLADLEELKQRKLQEIAAIDQKRGAVQVQQQQAAAQEQLQQQQAQQTADDKRLFAELESLQRSKAREMGNY